MWEAASGRRSPPHSPRLKTPCLPLRNPNSELRTFPPLPPSARRIPHWIPLLPLRSLRPQRLKTLPLPPFIVRNSRFLILNSIPAPCLHVSVVQTLLPTPRSARRIPRVFPFLPAQPSPRSATPSPTSPEPRPSSTVSPPFLGTRIRETPAARIPILLQRARRSPSGDLHRPLPPSIVRHSRFLILHSIRFPPPRPPCSPW
jgi:hypothetical protein